MFRALRRSTGSCTGSCSRPRTATSDNSGRSSGAPFSNDSNVRFAAPELDAAVGDYAAAQASRALWDELERA